MAETVIYTATCPECQGVMGWASPRMPDLQDEIDNWAMEGMTIAMVVDEHPERLGHAKTCQRTEEVRQPTLCTECGKEAGSVYREIAKRKVCMNCNPFKRCDDCGGLLEHKGTPNWMNCFQCVECGKKVSR